MMMSVSSFVQFLAGVVMILDIQHVRGLRPRNGGNGMCKRHVPAPREEKAVMQEQEKQKCALKASGNSSSATTPFEYIYTTGGIVARYC
jgi:hypothetical protein